MLSFRPAILSALIFASGTVGAAQTIVLPAWVCSHPDAIFVGGFEDGVAVPHDPSGGSGGAHPGSFTRTLHVSGLGSGTQKYYVYVPNDYTPSRSWPLVLALHGTAPAPGTSYATAVRDTWALVAASGHFIVAAPVADQAVDVNGQAGVTWMVPPTFGRNDYDLFAAIRADLEGAYNIERTRLYAWGFSAGGDVVHGLGLDKYSSVFNANTLAAYSVSAGDLAGYACADLADADCNALLANSPRKVPVDIHVGTGDSYYLQSTADDHNRFVGAGWADGQTFHYATFNGNHTYAQADLSDAWANLCPYAVVP